MRERFNLDIPNLERIFALVHGNYGVGKTHFLGDMLREEQQRGGVRFLNVRGEDGYLSLANLGVGDVGETVDTLADLQAALKDYRAEGLRALAVDGMKQLGQLVIKSVCGERLPSVGKGSDDWQRIHKEFETLVPSLRTVAPIVLCASASDRSMDQITGETSLTPDFPGRQAAASGGMFDFVFVMRAQVIGPNKVRRVLQCAPVANTVIRSRLPRPLPAEIDLPENGGGWKKLMTEIESCLKKASKEAA